MTTDVLYILFTIALVLLLPIVEYYTRNEKRRRSLLAVNVVCALTFIVITVVNVTSSNSLDTKVTALQEYSSEALLNAAGYPALYRPGEGITFKSQLITTLQDTYDLGDDGTYNFHIDSGAEQVYLSLLEERPKFPFPHFLYALCLYDQGDPNWRTHAEEAKRILELTTLIDGHDPQHDEFLQKTLILLSGRDPRSN
jgi:hypothetical protein